MSTRARRRNAAIFAILTMIGLVLPSSWGLAQPAVTKTPTPHASTPPEISQPDPPPEAPAPLAEALTGAAKDDYEAAVLLFEDGDAAGALLKFRAAYEASGDPRLLWNMAACEKRQRHYAKMLPLIEQYLEKGGALVSETERIEANTLIETLQPFVAIVQVSANERDAEVFIDGELIGKTPLAPQRVDMGTRRFALKKPGFVDWTSTEQIAGGMKHSIVAKLQEVRHVGTLRIITDRNGAIRVDGKLVGHGRWEGELPSGTHGVEVRSPGMQTYQGDAAVLDGQSSTLRVGLKSVAKPPATGLPAWVWIAGGALLTAGVGVGTYALLSPGERRTAPPLEGTMQPGAIQMP